MLAVHDVGDLERMPKYNQIETDADGRIAFFEEKPRSAHGRRWRASRSTSTRARAAARPRVPGGGKNPDQPGRLIEWLYPRTPVYTWRLPGRVVRHRLRRDARGRRRDLLAAVAARARVGAMSRLGRHSRRADTGRVLELLLPERCAICAHPGNALCDGCRRAPPAPRAALRALRLTGRLARPSMRRMCRAAPRLRAGAVGYRVRRAGEGIRPRVEGARAARPRRGCGRR